MIVVFLQFLELKIHTEIVKSRLCSSYTIDVERQLAGKNLWHVIVLTRIRKIVSYTRKIIMFI